MRYRFHHANHSLNNSNTKVPEGIIESAAKLEGKTGSLDTALSYLKQAAGPNVNIIDVPAKGFLKCSFTDSGMIYSYKLIEYVKLED